MTKSSSHGSAWRFGGVSGRLTLGLIGLLLLTGLISGGAVYQMHAMTASLDRLIEDNFEPLLDAEDLVQRVQILVALSPKLLNARTGFEIDNLQLQIVDAFTVLDRRLQRLDHSGHLTFNQATIAKQRDALRVAIDHLITLVRRQLQAKDDMAEARRGLDRLLDPISGINAGAQNNDPGQGTSLAPILYQASLANDPAEIERGRKAVHVLLDKLAAHGFSRHSAELDALVEGGASVFSTRQRQLELELKLQGEAGNTNLRANQLVYAVANLTAGLRQLTETTRREGKASVDRATFRASIILTLAAMIDLTLVAYLKISVLRRLVALRNSVVSSAAGSPMSFIDNGGDEIGDLARSLHRFIELIGIKEEELRLLAATDVLTGLSNRRDFMVRGQAEIMRALRYGSNACAMMLDIDHFKRVNDSWGHGVGDDVIRQVAAVAGDTVRVVDIIGRIGGEEFAVLLPETSIEGALAVAERLRADVASRTVSLAEGQILNVTISIGVAEIMQEDQSLGQLLGRADTALYEAKQLGRNRVCVFTPPRKSNTPVAVSSETQNVLF